MSGVLEVTPSKTQGLEAMSAPPSADFYIPEAVMNAKPRYQRRPFLKPPAYFSRDENDQIDFENYLDYLVDDPDDAPIQITDAEREVWMYHHPYYQRDFYQQPGISRYMRDTVLAEFGNSPYNQLTMRRLQEVLAHKKYEEQVSPPPSETMKKALIDYKYLDVLGAAALGRRVALVPEALGHLVPGASPNKQFQNYSPLEKAKFFDQEMSKALKVLDSPLVTPQRVITGVIRRTARLFNNETLSNAADIRLSEDPFYYPVRLRSTGQLYPLSLKLLQNICLLENVIDRDETALQTGVDELELVA